MQAKAMPTVNSLEDYLGAAKSMREWRTQFGMNTLSISESGRHGFQQHQEQSGHSLTI